MGSVNLSTEEYEELRQARLRAEGECARLEGLLVEARAADPEGRVRPLMELARALIEPLRFAVGNMPPEVTRKWPVQSIKTISIRLSALPDFSTDDETLAAELMVFANDIERNERERAANDHLVANFKTPKEALSVDDEKASGR